MTSPRNTVWFSQRSSPSSLLKASAWGFHKNFARSRGGTPLWYIAVGKIHPFLIAPSTDQSICHILGIALNCRVWGKIPWKPQKLPLQIAINWRYPLFFEKKTNSKQLGYTMLYLPSWIQWDLTYKLIDPRTHQKAPLWDSKTNRFSTFRRAQPGGPYSEEKWSMYFWS